MNDVNGILFSEMFELHNPIIQLASMKQLRDNVVVELIFQELVNAHDMRVGLKDKLNLISKILLSPEALLIRSSLGPREFDGALWKPSL